jgi:hypothetical protein
MKRFYNPFLVSAQTIRLKASIELLTARRTMLLLFNKRPANLLRNRIFVRALEFGCKHCHDCLLVRCIGVWRVYWYSLHSDRNWQTRSIRLEVLCVQISEQVRGTAFVRLYSSGLDNRVKQIADG